MEITDEVEISDKVTVELTPDEVTALEHYRMQTGKTFPVKRPVGGIPNNITYRQDAFAREVARIPSEKIKMKELAKAYLRVASTKKPWDRVKVLMADPKVIEQIEVYRRVYSTDRDLLLAEREKLTGQLKEKWEKGQTVSTGETTCTQIVKTSDLLTAYKDRELLYLGEEKKDDGPAKVIINITGDVKKLIEQATAIDAEITEVNKP
jgi:hypothetical protein